MQHAPDVVQPVPFSSIVSLKKLSSLLEILATLGWLTDYRQQIYWQDAQERGKYRRFVLADMYCYRHKSKYALYMLT